MTRARSIFLILFSLVTLVAYNNCGKNGFENALSSGTGISVLNGSNAKPLTILGTEANVVKINIGCYYVNEPCISVTICEPGTMTCQTIPNILLDTGSYGLRIFSSAISLNLPARTAGSGTLTECVGYADGSSHWGPVKSADVVLGQKRTTTIPIQVLDANFGSVPSDCGTPDASPSAAGFNGILGVGVFIDDCGSGCATVANNKVYYSCAGASCIPTTLPVSQQVSNPIAFMTGDNNGVILQLDAIPSAGSTAASGWMVMGIGTQANNTPKDVNAFPADGNGYFKTTFNGKTYNSSFIDSGSNGLFFPGSSVITACSASGSASGFFCPASTLNLTAIQAGASGSPAVNVNFQIINGEQALALSNPNIVFNNLGGNSPDLISGSFDWGLPFYLGRTVYHGFDRKSSSLGSGAYFAW